MSRAAIRRAVYNDVVAAECCHYCGSRMRLEVDHVLPVSRGGTNDRDNLVAACHSCNFNKLDFTVEEWKAWRAEVGLPWPPEPFERVVTRMVEEAMAAAHPADASAPPAAGNPPPGPLDGDPSRVETVGGAHGTAGSAPAPDRRPAAGKQNGPGSHPRAVRTPTAG